MAIGELMYLAAHRVRSLKGEVGINAVLYLHDAPADAIDWANIQRIAEETPGRVALIDDQITPGGNRVMSFLDVAAPDGTPQQVFFDALDAFLPAFTRAARLPFTFRWNSVGIRFGAQIGLEFTALEEYAALRTRVLHVLEHWIQTRAGS